jgi:hypothetical protein
MNEVRIEKKLEKTKDSSPEKAAFGLCVFYGIY